MKTSTKHLSDTKVLLTIAVDADELKKAELVALDSLGKEIKVPGFRKGKVPASVVAKHASPAELQERTLDRALSRAVVDAFTEEGIQALDRPEVEVKKFVPGETLEFTAEAEVIPPITLGDYRKLKVAAEKVTVAESDVQDVITRIQESFATTEEVTRAAKDGDEVVIDFVGSRDGTPFDGGTANDMPLRLGSGQFIPGFEEGVVGHKAGDAFDLELTFPEDYHAKELKGAKVVFAVTLKAVKERALPELNDELAAKCGPFTTMDELRADITRELTTQKEREAAEKRKDALVGQLVEKSTVPAPEILIKDQERSIEQDFVQNLAYQGISLDSYLETQGFATKEEWLDKEARPAAERRVKSALVLGELAKELKIEATADELAEHINRYREQYAGNADALKRFEDPEVHRDIANRLLTEKTVDKLVELNSK